MSNTTEHKRKKLKKAACDYATDESIFFNKHPEDPNLPEGFNFDWLFRTRDIPAWWLGYTIYAPALLDAELKKQNRDPIKICDLIRARLLNHKEVLNKYVDAALTDLDKWEATK